MIPSGRRAHSSYPRWWVILAIWTAWGLLLSTQVAVYVRLGGKPMPFLTALRLNMPGALVWAIASAWRFLIGVVDEQQRAAS